MISDNNKKKIEKKMKNVEVVEGKRNITSVGIKKQTVKTVDELKEKFSKEDSNSKINQLKKKFLGNTSAITESSDSAIGNDTSDDKDIEVGLIKKKNKASDADGIDERTIIISNKNGILGSQG